MASMASFDLEGARRAGASDEDIARFLGQKYGYDVDAALSAGATPTQIAEHLAASPLPTKIKQASQPQQAKAADISVPEATQSTMRAQTPPTSNIVYGMPIPILGGLSPREIVTAGKNFPSDLWDIIKGTARAVSKPEETIDTLSSAIAGGISKAIPERWSTWGRKVTPEAKEKRQQMEGIASGVAENIGSQFPFSVLKGSEAAKKSIVEHPATSLLNISSLAGIGKSIAGVSKLDDVSDLLSTTSKTTNPVAVATMPIKAVNSQIAPATRAKALQRLEEARQRGIDLTLGEALGSPNLMRAETWMERLPFGMGISGFRKKVLNQTNKAIEREVAKYIADPTDLSGTANRPFVKKLYDKTMEIVGQDGDTLPLYPRQTAEAAKEILDRYPDIFKKFQDTKREALLKDIVAGTTYRPSKYEDISKLIEEGGDISKIPVPKNQVTFSDMWELRDSVGDMIGVAKKAVQRNELEKTTLSRLNRLYSAINDDIDAWAKSIGKPELREAINTANEAYQRYVIKFNILQDALAKSRVELGGDTVISPLKFANEIRKEVDKQAKLERNAIKGLFTKEEIDSMVGLAKILNIAKRAGQYMENVPTSDRWAFPFGTLAAYSAGGTKAAGATIGLSQLMKFLTTTKLGKDLMLRASKAKPMSAEMSDILNIAMQAQNVSRDVVDEGNIKSDDIKDIEEFLGIK